MQAPKQPENIEENNQDGQMLTEDPEKIQESSKLLTIFPKEIWLLILGNIFLPKDLCNLGKASWVFERLLPSLKTKRLFPDVIKIVASKFHWNPHNTEKLLLACRLVCRTWETGVNTVLQSSYTCNNHKVPMGRHSYCTLLQPITTHFRTTEKLLNFLQHFDEDYASRNRNPFTICRGLSINFRNELNDVAAFTQGTRQILRKYGHKILQFKIWLHQPDASCYEQLPELLKFMPNLKVLVIDCNSEFSDDQLKALELSMQSSEFPAMPSLQHLQLLELPRPVFDAFLHNYSQVPVLTTTSYMSRKITSLYTHHLPNLTQLAFCIDSNEELNFLETSNAMWPLTTLRVRLGTIKLDWERLFQILENRWRDTLTELEIETFDVWDTSMQIFPSLNLPKLKMFIMVTLNFIPLDFTLPMSSSLEWLAVWYRFRPTEVADFEANENTIKFYSFRANLRDSNIWTLFPKLEVVEYNDRDVGLRRCRKSSI